MFAGFHGLTWFLPVLGFHKNCVKSHKQVEIPQKTMERWIIARVECSFEKLTPALISDRPSATCKYPLTKGLQFQPW